MLEDDAGRFQITVLHRQEAQIIFVTDEHQGVVRTDDPIFKGEGSGSDGF